MEAAKAGLQLNPEHLPDLMDIDDAQALEYLIQLLDHLMALNTAERDPSNNAPRRPSYDDAVEMHADVVRQLAPKHGFIVDAIDTDPVDAETEAEADEHSDEVAWQKGAELYKRFWLKDEPPITLRDYIHRFHRYCRSSPATYITAGCLIYSVSLELKRIPVTQRNVHRLFCAAFLVSAKFIEDNLYSMSRYATTSGLKKPELAMLELSFLVLVNFDIKADREVLKAGLRNWARLNAEAGATCA